MAESSEEVSAAKRRRTFSEGEKPSFSKPKSAAEASKESSDVKSDCAVKTNDVSEPTKPEGKHVTDGEQVSSRKDRKRKRSSIQSSSEPESELAATTAKAVKTGNNSAAKSDTSHHGASIVDEGDNVAKPNQGSKHSLQSSAEDVNQSVKKQKHAKKLHKEKKCKNKQKPEPPRLRVISKLVLSVCINLLNSCRYMVFFTRLQYPSICSFVCSLKGCGSHQGCPTCVLPHEKLPPPRETYAGSRVTTYLWDP